MSQQQRKGGTDPTGKSELRVKDLSGSVPNISKTIEGIEEALQQREDFYSELVCPICGLPCSHCSVACDINEAITFDDWLQSDVVANIVENTELGQGHIDNVTKIVSDSFNDQRNREVRSEAHRRGGRNG